MHIVLEKQYIDDMLMCFQFLRVLNLSGSGIEGLSAKISKLIYLRYLDLCNIEIEDLPNSICKLYNLQSLESITTFHSGHILQLSLPVRYSDAN